MINKKIPVARARAVTSSAGVAYGPNVITGYGPAAANLIIVSFLKSICQQENTYMQIVHTSSMSLHLIYKTDSHSYAKTTSPSFSSIKKVTSVRKAVSARTPNASPVGRTLKTHG